MNTYEVMLGVDRAARDTGRRITVRISENDRSWDFRMIRRRRGNDRSGLASSSANQCLVTARGKGYLGYIRYYRSNRPLSIRVF